MSTSTQFLAGERRKDTCCNCVIIIHALFTYYPVMALSYQFIEITPGKLKNIFAGRIGDFFPTFG